MTKIVISHDGVEIEERALPQGTLTVGRRADSGLCLNDAAASGSHAKIVTLFNASYVQDLNSTNGTYVNGKRITTHTLHPGDVITIGRHQLRVEAE